MDRVMRLSLVGMSGSGKSFWSGKLSRVGFRRVCCDDLIAARLVAELGRKHGSITAVGRWMGFPFDPHYKEHEAAYLACEMGVMAQILGEVGEVEDHPEQAVVIDTTGSVIYTGEEILSKLRACTTIVHLATPLEIQRMKLRAYVKNPRPILWRDAYSKRAGETNEEALARCYPELLTSRELQYKELAHVTISYYKHRKAGFGVEELLDEAGVKRANEKDRDLSVGV
jgi:shikimate kinase